MEGTMEYTHTQGFEKYVSFARKAPMLDAQEEFSLASGALHNNTKAAGQLIACHLKLVLKLAHTYKGYGFPLEDIVAQGNLGLMDALRHFDPNKGFRFSTYAMWWVRASIHEYILQNWSVVRLSKSRTHKKLFFTLRKTLRQIEAQIQAKELPTTTDKVAYAASKLGVELGETQSMLARLTLRDGSLNAPILEGNEEETELLELLADEEASQEERLMDSQDKSYKKVLLMQAIANLNPREQIIFTGRRLNEQPQTLEEISHKLGISRERVRQIENSAFIKVQKNMQRTYAF
jgi:RNA polymerase sigma-32 factor